MYAVRPVDAMGMIPLLSSFCCGVSSLISRSVVRMRPSARPCMVEALQASKANSYPEYGSIPVRTMLCLFPGSKNGREVALPLCWWDLLEICPLGCWEKLFIERCLTIGRYVGVLEDAGEGLLLSTLQDSSGAVGQWGSCQLSTLTSSCSGSPAPSTDKALEPAGKRNM